MRNKTLIYTIVLLVILGVAAGIHFTREDTSFDNDQGKEIDVEPNVGQENDPETKKLENEESDSFGVGSEGVDEIKMEEDRKVLANEDFSITLPQGWEGRPAPMGASAMAIDINEEVTDPAAKKINFQSYFAISYDTLQDRSREEYVQYIKDSLTVVSPEVNFAEEKQIDFKVLMILVWTDGEDVWTLSLNTTENKWEEYKDLFYQTADNFQIKLK
jgi:hypothetical protein